MTRNLLVYAKSVKLAPKEVLLEMTKLSHIKYPSEENLSFSIYVIPRRETVTRRVGNTELGRYKNRRLSVISNQRMKLVSVALLSILSSHTVDGVEITGSKGFGFEKGAAFVTVQGFNFTHAASINMKVGANNVSIVAELHPT
jgi:hypothetical protein